MQPRFKLTLYVTPDSSGKALADVYRALQPLAYNDYQLEIVDVLQESERAKKSDILGTPTLIYHAPDGDKLVHKVSDLDLVRQTLGITPPDNVNCWQKEAA